jgi:hypothetical protein
MILIKVGLRGQMPLSFFSKKFIIHVCVCVEYFLLCTLANIFFGYYLFNLSFALDFDLFIIEHARGRALLVTSKHLNLNNYNV